MCQSVLLDCGNGGEQEVKTRAVEGARPGGVLLEQLEPALRAGILLQLNPEPWSGCQDIEHPGSMELDLHTQSQQSCLVRRELLP